MKHSSKRLRPMKPVPEQLSKQRKYDTPADCHDLLNTPFAWRLCKRWRTTLLGQNSRSRPGSAVVHSLPRLDPARLATERERQLHHDASRVPAVDFPKREVSVQLFLPKLEILFVWFEVLLAWLKNWPFPRSLFVRGLSSMASTKTISSPQGIYYRWFL